MIIRSAVFFLVLLFIGCSPLPEYVWQDSRAQNRENATEDLRACQEFASRQYKPGMPAGEEYINQQNQDMSASEVTTAGEWRPDRSPDKTVNVHSMQRHDVRVGYTGYPGELDYYPDYLDDILEKCMRDRGWEYSEVKE